MLISKFVFRDLVTEPKQNSCPTQIPAQWSGVPIAILGPNEARLTKEKIVREIKHRSEVRMCNRSSEVRKATHRKPPGRGFVSVVTGTCRKVAAVIDEAARKVNAK